MKILLSIAALLFGLGSFAQTTLKTEPFTKIKLKSTAEIILKYDSFEGITFEGDGPDAKKLISKDTLIIDKDFDKSITVHIKKIDMIIIEGNGIVTGKEKIMGEKLSLSIKGGGKMTLSIETSEINAAIAGTGQITLSGSAKEESLAIVSSGKIFAENLKAKNCNATISGDGQCKVDATDELNANITGSGIIWYKSAPKEINKNIIGSGSLKAMVKSPDSN